MKRYSSRIVAVVLTFLAIATALGAIALAGTKTGLAIALAAALGPLGAWGAVFSPLVFPFTVFLMLVPFDNLLAVSSFGTLTKIVGLLCGASFAFFLLRKRRLIIPDDATLYWCYFGCWAVASMLWAIDPIDALPHLLSFLELLGLYVLISLMPATPRLVSYLCDATVASGVVAATYGALLFRSGIGVSSDQRLFISNDNSAIDPNQFAAALLLPISLSIVGVATTHSWFKRAIYGMALCVLILGVAISGSRGALLSIAALTAVLVYRSRGRLVIGLIGLFGAGVGLFFNANILARFATAESSGGAGRTDIWRVGIAAFKDHPIMGQGFGNFPFAFDRAFITVSQHYFTRWHRAAHDIIISTAVELGIFGVILLGVALYKQLRSLRSIGPAHPLRELRVALEAATIGVFVASIFLDTLTTKYFWLVPILIALTRNAVIKESEQLATDVSPVLQTSLNPR